MKLIPGKSYIWQGKRAFVFIEKIGREYFFSCADFDGPVSLKAHELKDLKQTRPPAATVTHKGAHHVKQAR